VFCNQQKISGVSEQVSAEHVSVIIAEALEAMKYASKHTENCDYKSRPIELAFYGGSFTALSVSLQESLLSAAQKFIASNPQNTIRVSTRPDCIDFDIVNRLKRFGVKTIELGAQSMCDAVLEMSGRGHCASDVRAASEVIRASGLDLILQMMTGLPGDSWERSLDTARQIVALSPNGVRIYPTVIVKGTKLFDLWRAGLYAEHSVSEAVSLCAELCLIFDQVGIPIIRLGLNPSDELSGGAACAGAYHPAFGELVYSKICFNKAVCLLTNVSPGSDVVILVSKGFVSKMTGRRRENIEQLIRKFSLKSLNVSELSAESFSKVLPEMAIHVVSSSQFTGASPDR